MHAVFRGLSGPTRHNPPPRGSNALKGHHSHRVIRAHATLKHARSRKTPVTELLVFLEAKPEATNDDMEQMVEQLWAMQYAAPGVLTACGGELSYPTPSLPVHQQPPQHYAPTPAPVPPGNPLEALPRVQVFPTGGFTHMVHFRFSNPAQARAFLQLPNVKSMLDATPAPPGSHDGPISTTCARAAVLAFEAKVETDMDALFRRQADFTRGEDLILILRGTSNCIPASALSPVPQPVAQEAPPRQSDPTSPRTPRSPVVTSPEQLRQKRVMMADAARNKAPQDTALRAFVGEMSLLAESSLAGALQVTTGPVLVLDPAQSMQPTDSAGSPPRSPPPQLAVADAGAAVLDLKFNGPMLGFKNTELLSGPCHVFMARFPSRQQLQAFRAARPVTALWQQRLQLEREPGRMVPVLPVCAELDIALHVAPTSNNNRR